MTIFYFIFTQFWSKFIQHMSSMLVIQLLQYNFRSMWCCSLDLKLFWCIFDIGPMIMYNAFFSVFSILDCSTEVFWIIIFCSFRRPLQERNPSRLSLSLTCYVAVPGGKVWKYDNYSFDLILFLSVTLLPLPLLLLKGWRLLYFFFRVFALY